MSGVVNKSVADKAVSVHADELVRKPFQPQELINRVKALLEPKPAGVSEPSPDRAPGPTALSNLFAPPPQPRAVSPVAPAYASQSGDPGQNAWSRSLAEAFTPRPPAPFGPGAVPPAPNPAAAPGSHAVNTASSPFAQPNALSAQSPAARPAAPADIQRLRLEIARLDLLVKKLQTELQIERQYNQALESQIRALTESA